mmetsp:Transcript_57512/g.130302  ORF Transcript_57512/g.130302 Transcript_57512/m.130302 type:complete len:436 (+) Transcript_57512:403-1710(+)
MKSMFTKPAFITAGATSCAGAALLLNKARQSSTRAACEDDPSCVTDYSSVVVLATKLQEAAAAAFTVLGQHDPFQDRPLDVLSAIRAFANIALEYDPEEFLGSKDCASDTAPPKSLITELVDTFELADAAYESTEVLSSKLRDQGLHLVYHEVESIPGKVSFFLAFDPKKLIAVIGIKGTQSPADVLTDLVCKAVPREHGDKIAFVHEGMSVAAATVEDQVFYTLLHLFFPQGYSVVITGHSLGAGTAALLGLALRERLAEDPRAQSSFLGTSWAHRVQVRAFATPPVIDLATTRRCQGFITSVVNNRDVIPRASVSNMVSMITMVSEVDKDLRSSEFNPSTYAPTREKVKQMAANVSAQAPQEKNAAEFLFVPGRVVYMYDEKKRPGQACVLTDGNHWSLRTINFSRSMITDHLAEQYRESLKRAMECEYKSAK